MGNASGAGIGAGWTQRQADLMIAVIACAWGSSYLMMQVGLSSIPPFGMVALRFGIAFVAVAIIFRKRLRELTTSVVARGAVLVVEWPDRAGSLIPADAKHVRFVYGEPENVRKIEF